MRFLSIYKCKETEAPPTQAEMDRMGKLIEEGMKAGTSSSVEGCLPSRRGARVRLANGKVTVTDGPFTEAKELIGGLAILKADSKEAAIELAGNSSRWPATASASCGAVRRRPERRGGVEGVRSGIVNSQFQT